MTTHFIMYGFQALISLQKYKPSPLLKADFLVASSNLSPLVLVFLALLTRLLLILKIRSLKTHQGTLSFSFMPNGGC